MMLTPYENLMAHRLTIGQIAQIVEADVLEVYKLVDEGHGDQALLVKIAERLPANPNPKCGWCGQEFPRKAKKKYCSTRCSQTSWQSKNRKRKIKAAFIGPIMWTDCPVCSVKFLPNGKRKYCSTQCLHTTYVVRKREAMKAAGRSSNERGNR